MQGIKLNMMRKNKNARHKINMVRKKKRKKEKKRCVVRERRELLSVSLERGRSWIYVILGFIF